MFNLKLFIMKKFQLIKKGVIVKESKNDSFQEYNKLYDEMIKIKCNDKEYKELKEKQNTLKKELDYINSILTNYYIIDTI